MPLVTAVGFGPGDIVSGGDPAPPQKGGTAVPHFSADVCCGQTVAVVSPCCTVRCPSDRVPLRGTFTWRDLWRRFELLGYQQKGLNETDGLSKDVRD